MLESVALAMIEYFEGDLARINHLLKVHSFAKIIAANENLDEQTRTIIAVAAYCHDIGIKVAETTLGYNTGKLQEKLGPKAAQTLLEPLGLDPNIIERVKVLIGAHHTYNLDLGIDYQILIEADALVNIFEDQMTAGQIQAFAKLFQTPTGLRLLTTLYDRD